jgi:hypothetical protein
LHLIHLTVGLSDQSDSSKSFLLCLSLHPKPFSQTGKWIYHVAKFETFVNFKNMWYRSVTMGSGVHIYVTWFKVKETPASSIRFHLGLRTNNIIDIMDNQCVLCESRMLCLYIYSD